MPLHLGTRWWYPECILAFYYKSFAHLLLWSSGYEIMKSEDEINARRESTNWRKL